MPFECQYLPVKEKTQIGTPLQDWETAPEWVSFALTNETAYEKRKGPAAGVLLTRRQTLVTYWKSRRSLPNAKANGAPVSNRIEDGSGTELI